MEFTTDKLKCPICHNSYDSSIRVPKILINCGHTICSVCLNTKILENEGKITCPEDLTLYEDIDSSDFFPTNKSLLQIVDTPPIFQSQSSFTNANTKNDYIRRSSTLRTSLKRAPSMQICSTHSLPLDVICIDEKIKVCSQCALEPQHFKHTIITDEEFMNQIDSLIDLFSEVDINLLNYNEKDNISTKKVLESIDISIDKLKKYVNDKNEEIIKMIKLQNEKVVSFLDNRKKELHDKYNSTSFDIKALIAQTDNWMETVKNKLDKLNDINEPSIECVKLIDDDPEKNQTALLNSGHQLIDRFTFIKKTEETINKLEEYSVNGINITQIEEPIYVYFKEEELDGQYTIKNNFFEIKENTDTIKALNLKEYSFEHFHKPLNTNIFSPPRMGSINYISNSINNTTIMTTDTAILNDLNRIPQEQTLTDIRTNYRSSKHPQSYYSVEQNLNQQNQTIPYGTSNYSTYTYNSNEKTPERLPQLTPSNSSSKIKSQMKNRAKTPDRDKKVFIKTQLKNESANFSRIDIGEEGVELICAILDTKKGGKYKEIKLVKSNLTDDSVIMLINSIIDNNINVGNLNLSNNGLSDEIGEGVIYMLKNYSYLKTLYLTNNAFTVQMKDKIKSYSSSGKRNVKIFI